MSYQPDNGRVLLLDTASYLTHISDVLRTAAAEIEPGDLTSAMQITAAVNKRSSALIESTLDRLNPYLVAANVPEWVETMVSDLFFYSPVNTLDGHSAFADAFADVARDRLMKAQELFLNIVNNNSITAFETLHVAKRLVSAVSVWNPTRDEDIASAHGPLLSMAAVAVREPILILEGTISPAKSEPREVGPLVDFCVRNWNIVDAAVTGMKDNPDTSGVLQIGVVLGELLFALYRRFDQEQREVDRHVISEHIDFLTDQAREELECP